MVSHLFKLCQLYLTLCESLALLHHWPSDKPEQVFFVAILETESRTHICEKCNDVTTKTTTLAKLGGILTVNEHEILRESNSNLQCCKRNRSGTNKVLVNKKMLQKLFFSITIYHILIVLKQLWGFGFWFFELYLN